jgi:predicted nuclease of predicted toxin-antitoxin system
MPDMKFLADAHISVEMAAMIRSLGHECAEGASIPPRMADIDVLRAAADKGEVVVTADKDFGELVFVHGISCPGVILIRVALADETSRVAHVRSIWPKVMTRLPGSFITVTASRIRARPIP